MRCAAIVALAVCAAHGALAQGSYPEPPRATRTFQVTPQLIAQAQTTQNPLSDFLSRNGTRYTLFPTAVMVPPGGWTVEWPQPAMMASEKYFVSWSKGGGRFWAVDCATQKVAQILSNTSVDLTCSHWAAMADKEVELYLFGFTSGEPAWRTVLPSLVTR